MARGAARVTLNGERYVILSESQYRRLRGRLGDPETDEPELPAPDARGRYPAVETVRALLARKIVRRRKAVGLTQGELAKRAGVRVETVNRLERAKHSASVVTVDKLVRALEKVEAQHAK